MLQTEDIEHVQRVDGLGTEHELNFFNFALRRQSRPRELHAHVLPVANRHAGNNDATAEDIAVAKTRGLRYLFVGADPLRAVDVAIRDPEGELLAHDPVAVIDEIARAARVAAQVQPELPRVALGLRLRDFEAERFEFGLEFFRESEHDARWPERVSVVVVEPSAPSALRELRVEPKDLLVDRLVEAELREGAALPPRLFRLEARPDDFVMTSWFAPWK